jgi:hypothetical protein
MAAMSSSIPSWTALLSLLLRVPVVAKLQNVTLPSTAATQTAKQVRNFAGKSKY